MSALTGQILQLVIKKPGLTDREITSALRGVRAPQQPINIAARALASKGFIERRYREDGLIGNYPSEQARTVRDILPEGPDRDGGATEVPSNTIPPSHIDRSPPSPDLEEDALKRALESWLKANGWHTTIAWRKVRGIDILAKCDSKRWVIEVKGIGSRPEMRVNYFIGILGETLQRMDDSASKYSIALPDVPQFRRLWERLPRLAKERTTITALFVDEQGWVTEVS